MMSADAVQTSGMKEHVQETVNSCEKILESKIGNLMVSMENDMKVMKRELLLENRRRYCWNECRNRATSLSHGREYIRYLGKKKPLV